MKEELVKIETVPTKLNELQKRKEELTKLVSETSEVVINGLHDTEGFKAAENNRKLIKKELSSIEKTRKDIKAPVLKIGEEIDEAAKELKAILEPESKRLIEITDKHKKEVEAEKQRQIEEQKEKLKERLRMIHELNPETDGYTHSLSFEGEEMSINNDEIEMLVDEQFHNLYFNMEELSKKIKEQKRIEEEKARVERERIEKEREAERIAQEKIRLAQEKENERIRIENEKAQKELERQREEIRLAQEKVKQEAEALERERKAKEAKELAEKQALEAEEAAKKAKLKAEKEAEEKRRQDIERQKMLAPFKDEAIKAIEKSYDLGFIEEKIKNEEVQEIIDQYLEEFVLSMGMAIERIRSL